MISPNTLLRGQSAASQTRSRLAYLIDMSRCSLVKQLATRLSQQAGKSLVMRDALHTGLLATVSEENL